MVYSEIKRKTQIATQWGINAQLEGYTEFTVDSESIIYSCPNT